MWQHQDGSLAHFDHLPKEQQRELIFEVRKRLDSLIDSSEESGDGQADGFLC